MLKISALLIMGAVLCLPAPLQAQSHIPENRVPGFGGTDARPGGPSTSGSDVGSNVGAGATASPVPDPLPPPASAPSVAESPPPLIGASRPLPLGKSTR